MIKVGILNLVCICNVKRKIVSTSSKSRVWRASYDTYQHEAKNPCRRSILQSRDVISLQGSQYHNSDVARVLRFTLCKSPLKLSVAVGFAYRKVNLSTSYTNTEYTCCLRKVYGYEGMFVRAPMSNLGLLWLDLVTKPLIRKPLRLGHPGTRNIPAAQVPVQSRKSKTNRQEKLIARFGSGASS